MSIFGNRGAEKAAKAEAEINEHKARALRLERRKLAFDAVGKLIDDRLMKSEHIDEAIELLVRDGQVAINGDGRPVSVAEMLGEPLVAYFDEASRLPGMDVLDRLFGKEPGEWRDFETILNDLTGAKKTDAKVEPIEGDACDCVICQLRRGLFGADPTTDEKRPFFKTNTPRPGDKPGSRDRLPKDVDPKFRAGATAAPPPDTDDDYKPGDVLRGFPPKPFAMPKGPFGENGEAAWDREEKPNTEVYVRKGYADLAHVLFTALEQAQTGKGRERHQRHETPFVSQPILKLTETHGIGFALGQAAKKMGEATRMIEDGKREKGLFELHGAINYIAAAIIATKARGFVED